jgi:hypothetical protein
MTASPIRRMGTSVGMADGSLAEGLNTRQKGCRTDTSILTTWPVLWDRSLTSRFGGRRIAACPSVQAFQG